VALIVPSGLIGASITNTVFADCQDIVEIGKLELESG
jgi:hypothetical protein